MIRFPQNTPVKQPFYKEHKWSIVMFVLFTGIVTFVYLFYFVWQSNSWSFIILTAPLLTLSLLFNTFAYYEDGLLVRMRFVPWKHIRSFEFIPIDLSHKYYGHTSHVNQGYELRIKTRGLPISCLVTTDDMKETLTKILQAHVANCEEIQADLQQNSRA